jgi:hypothetical protein
VNANCWACLSLASGHDDDRTLESNNCDTITLPAAHHILAVDEPGARALQRPSVVAAALSPIESITSGNANPVMLPQLSEPK